MISNTSSHPTERFNYLYQKHINYLSLQSYSDSTVDAYARAIRRIGANFDFQIEQLTEDQLLTYFAGLQKSHSISTVKLDLYGLKFFYQRVLKRNWEDIPLVKSPRVIRVPDILTQEEIQQLLVHTRVLSYRVFFYTSYSMGLRLSEALALEVGDIDNQTMRVHIRKGKGQKDRLVPLPMATLLTLRNFWKVHRHPRFLFPNRKKMCSEARFATSHLNKGGVQKAMREVVKECGFKKTFLITVYAIVMRPTY